jgi:N-acyl-D-aspartate/D-glutamate deacylase
MVEVPRLYDLVIRGGTVADGTGDPLRKADVAVADGRVAEIGEIAARGHKEISAKDLLVTPGFVDIHTHYDGQATWNSHLDPSSWHGVTTVVMGNCGVGFAPVHQADHHRLIELKEGVEDIPGSALHEGLTWDWRSFDEYLNALDRRPHDVDIAAQIPHAALRVYVMGDRAARFEPATNDDIARMRRLATEAIRGGALGFSTSRTLNHRTLRGDPTPKLRASEDELLGIAMGLADAGTGVIEMISDWPDLEAGFSMVRRFVEASGGPLTLSLAQSHSAPDSWRPLLVAVERTAQAGLPIKAQVAPRPIGMVLGLQASRNPFSAYRAFAEIAEKSLADKVCALRDPSFRNRLVAEARLGQGSRAKRLEDFKRIYPMGRTPDYEPPSERSVSALAAAKGCSAVELVCDLLIEDDGRALLFAPFANYAEGNLEACREMMLSPHTVMGLGDGGAHVGLISDASFTTFLLTHWGRDRPIGRFPVSRLVRKLTAETARSVGLHDRGVIAPGMKADLNVIDFDKLALDLPIMAFDLPAGGKRLLQRARGYRATIVSRVVTYSDGEATGELPGKLVRGQREASTSLGGDIQ